jgi:alkaline phosphatase D
LRVTFLLLLFVAAGASWSHAGSPEEQPCLRIAFGSCAKQDQPQPIWDSIVDLKPQMFVFLGDNIYGDTNDITVLNKKWNWLGHKTLRLGLD